MSEPPEYNMSQAESTTSLFRRRHAGRIRDLEARAFGHGFVAFPAA